MSDKKKLNPRPRIMWDGEITTSKEWLFPSESIRKFNAIYEGLELMFCSNDEMVTLADLYRAYSTLHNLRPSTAKNWIQNNHWGERLFAAKAAAIESAGVIAPVTDLNFSAAKWA